MESHLSEDALWAGALAARLRVLQANFADDDPATRREFIGQEIERALKGCVSEKKKTRLAALRALFPSGPGTAPARESQPLPAGEVAETPEALCERLLEIIPTLPAVQQTNFRERFTAAGLVAEVSKGGVFEITPELQKRLGLSGSQSVSVERAAKSFALLLDTVLALDQLVWTLWKQISPRSAVRKEADFAKLTAEYLSDSREVSTAQVVQSLERTRKLIASLLGAIGRAGAAFARERARLFDPNAIEADARAEKKWNESVEFACWRKYVQLCKEYGAEPIMEKGIQEAMAKAAENLLLGRPST